MWTVSEDFTAELGAGDQRITTLAEVLSEGVVTYSGLGVISGSVDIDATASARRRCTVTLVDESGELTPNDADDILSPYGYELRLWRGLVFDDGGKEMVPLGTFRISEARSQQSDKGRIIALSGFDRSRAVARARFETPYTVAAGSNYATAIQALISDRLPGVSFNFVSILYATPLLVFDQMGDPWKAAQDMAESIGCELFFDAMGVCVLRPVPEISADEIVASYVEGESATILSIENRLNDEPGYNGVVVDGEPADLPPVHAVAYDEDPSSPTYYLGRYGKVPQFYRSQFIATQEQADETAASMLRSKLGGTEVVTFSAIPNPAHEAGDVVAITVSESGIDDNYIVDRISLPLGAEAEMAVTTRKRATL